MASLNKLVKALEAVISPSSSTGTVSVGKVKQDVGIMESPSNESEQSSNLGDAQSILDYSKSIVGLSFPTSKTQHGQKFLSKKEHSLTVKEKLTLCHSVSESIIMGTKAGSVDSQKLLCIGIETIMVLIDDENSDVRMNADEALNRVVRSLSDINIGKVQLELFKEIKKNGSVRCLRAALIRFAILCHHIRPQKCRAYIQSLIPHLLKIAKRQEENLLETLSLSLEKILPVLGHFTNDNEIRSLLKSFLPNISHSSASIRRSCCSVLVLLCCHSRKPSLFSLWLLDVAVQILLPLPELQEEKLLEPVHNSILGALLIIRSLAPYFEELRTSSGNLSTETLPEKEGASQIDCMLTFDQTVQVYEICLQYCQANEANVVTASLETLQALLQSSSQHLLIALTSSEGITSSRITGEHVTKLPTRTYSEISLVTSPADCESLENITDWTNQPNFGAVASPRALIEFEPESLKDISGSHQMTLHWDCSSSLQSLTCESTTEYSPNVENISDVLLPNLESDTETAMEMGQISGNAEGPLFGRDLQVGESSMKKKRKSLESSDKSSMENLMISEDINKTVRNIGSFFDEDFPVKYLVRFLCSSFLLSGHPHTIISDRMTKVSIKALALNCVGVAIPLLPSVMEESLFIPTQEEELQCICDIILYHQHPDPQLRACIAMVIGHFINASLITNGGDHLEYNNKSLSLKSLLGILCKLLHHSSSITVRGAITGLNICLPELLHSPHIGSIGNVLEALLEVVSYSYWLVKVALCDLLGSLPVRHIEYMESKGFNLQILSTKSSSLAEKTDRFSCKIIVEVLLPLLCDHDRRVRTAASATLVRLLPELIMDGDLILKSSLRFSSSGIFRQSDKELFRAPLLCPEGSFSLLSSFHKLEDNQSSQAAAAPLLGLNYLRWKHNDDNLACIVNIFTMKLLTSSEKYTRVGCLEALSHICDEFPPVVHPEAWKCHLPPDLTDQNIHGKANHIGLVTLLLSLSGEFSLASDLPAQQFILNISCNWMAGWMVLMFGQGPTVERGPDQLLSPNWPLTQYCKLIERIMQHILRILCIYSHILEVVTPSVKGPIVTGSVAALSPLKRKSHPESVAEKLKGDTLGTSEKSRDALLAKDKKSSRSYPKGMFMHSPEYIKLYDVLKNASANYKMSLEESSKMKFCCLLQTALSSLAVILEISPGILCGPLADELLQYLISTASSLPTHTIFCGQQLLKCLFGSNIFSLWDQFSTSSATHSDSLQSSDLESPTLSSVVIQMPFVPFKKHLSDLKEGKAVVDIISLRALRNRHTRNLNTTKTSSFAFTDRTSLSSYIRLFEPLVIKALKLYTVSSDVGLQRTVLELLIYLVRIRVNYCLLDSEQTFIGYVIKQFEYMEEGQIKDAEQLIPSMFNFLVLLSYERHHSKSIIGVPKIIQLCDGLMASGQPPLSHCVLALKPLVEDLFLDRCNGSTFDQKELDTQKEVICSMLLRLAHYHEVLQLLSVVLISTHDSNRDRWKKLSRQILDTLLPLMSKLQINISDKVALSSLEEIFTHVCPSVFRPPDAILKALLTSPCEIETTAGVERWVGGIILLLRVLVTKTSVDMIIDRLNHLGLCMQYISLENEPSEVGASMTFSLHQHLSPKRYGPRKDRSNYSEASFVDPLYAKATIKPQTALARFLLEVLRVVACELKSLEFMKIQRMSNSSQTFCINSKFLVHLTSQLLMLLIYLAENGIWEPVMTEFKNYLSEGDLLKDINEPLLFIARWRPGLALMWYQLLGWLDCFSETLWSRVLQSTHADNSPLSETSDVWPKSAASVQTCLSLAWLKKSTFFIFCGHVLKHNQQVEWLTELVVEHICDIVETHKDPPVEQLLQWIYSSSSASALLVQAFHARCDYVSKAEHGNAVISIMSGVHASQSGPLVEFLINKMIGLPYLMISRSAALFCSQRLHYLIANAKDTSYPGGISVLHQQLNSKVLKKLILNMAKDGLNIRYGQVYSLLQQMLSLQQSESETPMKVSIPVPSAASRLPLDLSWYTMLVRDRCRIGEGGSQECIQLLSHLNYNSLLSVMSSEYFNLQLLPSILQHILFNESEKWSKSPSDVGAEGNLIDLMRVSKIVIVKNLSKVINSLPKMHSVFSPGGNSKYCTDFESSVFGDSTLLTLVEVLSPSVSELMSSYSIISWNSESDPHLLKLLARFTVFNLEFLHWKAFMNNLSIYTTTTCLKCVHSVLRNAEVSDLIGASHWVSSINSMASSLHFLSEFWIYPSLLPSLPQCLLESLQMIADEDVRRSYTKMMQLTIWLENDGAKSLPSCLVVPVRGTVIGLGRTALLNAIVRMPPELWSLDWSPDWLDGTLPAVHSSITADLLLDTEVLKQFIFRNGLFGFVSRHQFEETWMQFLSVLNSTPQAEASAGETACINLALSLAVIGVTNLLMQTSLTPYPGDTNNYVSWSPFEPPSLSTNSTENIEKLMKLLLRKIAEVQHIILPSEGVGRKKQLQLHHLADRLLQESLVESRDEKASETKANKMEKLVLDVQSCIYFLQHHYSSLLSTQTGLCSSVTTEVVKSLSILCDAFTSVTHYHWVLNSILPFYFSHPVEDFITSQYIIIATCKSLATLRIAKQEVSSSAAENVLHIVEDGLRSSQTSVRICALQGVLILLQVVQDDMAFLNITTTYILKSLERKNSVCESHLFFIWEIWVNLMEKFETQIDSALPSSMLVTSLSTAVTASISTVTLHQLICCAQRLILVEDPSSEVTEMVRKLVTDLLCSSSTASIYALPLFLMAMHRRGSPQNSEGVSLSEDRKGVNPEEALLAPNIVRLDPEVLLHFMEKISILFDKIRVGYPFEADVLSGILGPCLLDILPASEILNKVITEFISCHQPHPQLLALTLFQVFEAAISEGSEKIVQEWVLLSLNNFTQKTPISLAVWCLSCFFIAASNDRWLRAAFPAIQSRIGKLDAVDIQNFCVAASHFRRSLASEEQRLKFDDTFNAAADLGLPFEELLSFIKDDCKR